MAKTTFFKTPKQFLDFNPKDRLERRINHTERITEKAFGFPERLHDRKDVYGPAYEYESLMNLSSRVVYAPIACYPNPDIDW